MIKVNVRNELLWLPIDELVPSQGDLKELSKENYEKLKNSILRNGFISPFFIWKNKQDVYEIKDGHQRRLTVIAMIEEGHNLPDLFPCVEIIADSAEEASRILLMLTSQFGKVTKQGLYEYMHDNQINVDELFDFNLDAFPMESFKLEYFEEINTDNQLDDVENTDKKEKQTICPNCGEVI
jgi:hypothetical protein